MTLSNWHCNAPIHFLCLFLNILTKVWSFKNRAHILRRFCLKLQSKSSALIDFGFIIWQCINIDPGSTFGNLICCFTFSIWTLSNCIWTAFFSQIPLNCFCLKWLSLCFCPSLLQSVKYCNGSGHLGDVVRRFQNELKHQEQVNFWGRCKAKSVGNLERTETPCDSGITPECLFWVMIDSCNTNTTWSTLMPAC